MTAAKPAGVAEKPWENPLVPHRRLREIYTAVVGARLLDQWAASQNPAQSARTHGEEAIRVSTLIGLEKGDLVADPTASLTTNYLLGAGGASLREAYRDPAAAKTLEDGRRGQRLRFDPRVSAEETLHLAVGAALALKTQGAGRLLVAFASTGAVSAEAWKQVLRTTGQTGAPILFVALPGSGNRSQAGALSTRSTGLGVPGIAVEAGDAVALYRVAQESAVRIRMGGGPVLIESVRVRFGDPKRRSEPVDVVAGMREVLLTKGAADEPWADRMEARLGTRLLGQLEAGRVPQPGRHTRGSGRVLR